MHIKYYDLGLSHFAGRTVCTQQVLFSYFFATFKVISRDRNMLSILPLVSPLPTNQAEKS